MKRIILLAPLAVLATACSSTHSTPERSDTHAPGTTSAATTSVATSAAARPKANGGAAKGGAGGTEAAAVAQAVTLWDTTGPCELMTDKFLASQTFVSDRELACKTFRSGWQPKQYSATDVIISDVAVTGDTAQATLGSNLADLKIRFSLVRGGPAWQIDAASTVR